MNFACRIPILSYVMAFGTMPILFWISYALISRLRNKTCKVSATPTPSLNLKP